MSQEDWRIRRARLNMDAHSYYLLVSESGEGPVDQRLFEIGKAEGVDQQNKLRANQQDRPGTKLERHRSFYVSVRGFEHTDDKRIDSDLKSGLLIDHFPEEYGVGGRQSLEGCRRGSVDVLFASQVRYTESVLRKEGINLDSLEHGVA